MRYWATYHSIPDQGQSLALAPVGALAYVVAVLPEVVPYLRHQRLEQAAEPLARIAERSRSSRSRRSDDDIRWTLEAGVIRAGYRRVRARPRRWSENRGTSLAQGTHGGT